MKKTFATVALILTAASYPVTAYAQRPTTQTEGDAKTTPAYARLILKKVEVQTELERMATELTPTTPTYKLKQFELGAVESEMARTAAITGAQVAKLTDAYGTLLLHKIALDVELQALLNGLTPQHPEIRFKRSEIANLTNEMSKLIR